MKIGTLGSANAIRTVSTALARSDVKMASIPSFARLRPIC